MKLQLVVLENSRRKHVFSLRSRETVIGRGEGCFVRIPSAEVSRRHCRLVQAGGRVTVIDLDSANGTFLNDELVTSEAGITAGDRLRVGPVTFYFEEAVPRLAGAPRSGKQGSATIRSIPKPAPEPGESTEPVEDEDAPPQQPVLDPAESLNLASPGQLRDLLLELDQSGKSDEKPRGKRGPV